MSRRAALAASGAGAVSSLVGCRRCGEDADLPRETRAGAPAPSPSAPLRAGEWRELVWTADEAPPEGEAALVRKGETDAAPLIVALHGRGESGRGLLAGASGFRDDYAIEKVEAALVAGKITAADLGGFTTDTRIAALQRSLDEHRYVRPTLVTPYCPVPAGRRVGGAGAFADFVCEKLLPRARVLVGHDVPNGRTAIDGISMGGRLALETVIARPGQFGSVGAMQPALSVDEAPALADALARAYGYGWFALRLASSDDDPFLAAVRALDDALARRNIPHQLVVTPGPHDYAWNRGPGAAELLMFHERALRGLTPP